MKTDTKFKLYFVNAILLFRPTMIEYSNCDYYGRRKRIYKTIFGKKYYGPWTEADLLTF